MEGARKPKLRGSAHMLERLSTPERIRAEQEVTRRYGAIMPFWMSWVIVSCLPVLALLCLGVLRGMIVDRSW